MNTSASMFMQWHQQSSAPLQPTRRSDAVAAHSYCALLSGRLVADLCLRCS